MKLQVLQFRVIEIKGQVHRFNSNIGHTMFHFSSIIEATKEASLRTNIGASLKTGDMIGSISHVIELTNNH